MDFPHKRDSFRVMASWIMAAEKMISGILQLQWRCSGRDGVSNHLPHPYLLKRLFRHISKKLSKLRVTGLCAGNSPVTGEFLAQMASNAEIVSIWWRHHAKELPLWPLLAHRRMETFCSPDLFNLHVTVPMPELVIQWLFKIQESTKQN